MDRPGLVLDRLDHLLPSTGRVLDVGAGDGFTGARIDGGERTVVALEPAAGMRRPDVPLLWTAGDAEALPFAATSFDAAYSTWAYFFTRDWDPSPGIAELRRVVRPGGPLVIVDNLGGDEFTALAPGDISADPDAWAAFGFAHEVVDTVFEFASRDDAERLFRTYFGDRAPADPKLVWTYRVGVFVGTS